MNKKEALKTIEINIRNGLSKIDIYHELSPKVTNTTDLKNYLAMVPDQKDRNKYHKINLLLIGSLVLYFVWKICYAFLIIVSFNSNRIVSLLLFEWLFFILPIFILIYGFYAWEFRGFIYNLLCVVCVFDIGVYFMSNNFSIASIVFFIIYAFPIVLVFCLAFYISKKVFPYYKWNGVLDNEKFNL
jgi:hypothetical protein